MIPKNPVYLPPEDETYQLLHGVAELGVGPMWLFGQVLGAFPSDNHIPIAVLRYTFGPLLFHRGPGDGEYGWLTKDLIQRWRSRVDIERLEILAGERPDLVSPTELWLVMYNAMMTAPMRTSMSEIYIWAAARSAAAAPDIVSPDNVASFHQRIGGNQMPVPSDLEVFDGRLTHEYRQLCQIVISKVVGAASKLIRTRRPTVADPPPSE